MTFTTIPFKNYKRSEWSGGTTTQLYIDPPEADYQKRNFNFRISTAKVKDEKSVFTSLPGVSRKIMVLEGEIIIHHEDHYTKKLSRLDVDAFEGDWVTSAVGTCTDFNLMTTENTRGGLSAVVIDADIKIKYPLQNNLQKVFLYVSSGKVRVELENQTHTLNKGCLLVIEKPINIIIPVYGIEKSELVISKIYMPENA